MKKWVQGKILLRSRKNAVWIAGIYLFVGVVAIAAIEFLPVLLAGSPSKHAVISSLSWYAFVLLSGVFLYKLLVWGIEKRNEYEKVIGESEKFLTNVFDSIPDGICVLDRFMNIVRVNRVLEAWYAHAMPLVGKKCYLAYHGRHKACDVCPTKKTLKTGEAAVEIVPNTGPGGEIRGWQELYSFPLHDGATGELCGAIEYVHDITDRKKAEDKIKEYSESLEDMVEQRTRELDAARSDLFAAANLAAMGRMGAGIAHQLNSPICGGMLLADTLADSLKDEDQKGKVKRIRAMFDDMHNVINCMLSLAGVSNKASSFKVSADINDMLKRIIGLVALETRERGITVAMNFDPKLQHIDASVGEFDQVFLNLIHNSIDAMEKGGSIELSTESAPGSVRVCVRDKGEGIPPGNLEKIFEPFFTTRRERRGFGLGLSIVGQIVEKYGGSLTVKSEVGKGSEFCVVLPVKKG